MLCTISLFKIIPSLRQRLNSSFYIRSIQVLFLNVHNIPISEGFVLYNLKLFFVDNIFERLSNFMKEEATKKEDRGEKEEKEQIDEKKDHFLFVGIELKTIPKKEVNHKKYFKKK